MRAYYLYKRLMLLIRMQLDIYKKLEGGEKVNIADLFRDVLLLS